MLNYESFNDSVVWYIKKLLSSDAVPYKDVIKNIKEFYIVSTLCVADDMGGVSTDKSKILEDNQDLVSISPYLVEGNFSNKFVCKTLISDDHKLLDVKKLCETYPDKTFYFSMGISTFPNNDKNISYDKIVKKLIDLDVDNLHVCFMNGWDMYTDQWEGFDRCEKIKRCFADWPEEKIKFLLCNISIVRKYRKYFPQADVQYFSIYPARIFDSPGKKTYPKRIVDKTHNQRRKKKTICLNNYEKRHRTEIVNLLDYYKDDVFISYREHGIYLDKEVTPKFNKNFEHDFFRNQDSPPYRIISNTYSWIATETLFYGSNPGTYNDNFQTLEGFVTEKTLKAFYFELPVLIVGLPRTYLHLRSIGYQTFPEFWDESFDTEENDSVRLELIKREIQKFLDKPIQEIHEMFWSPEIQNKLENNKNLFLKYAKNDPFSNLGLKEKYGY
tara:strand:- start:1138 stop:2463 length:1326 start_codon:yes stop_codon:yes gene_type:complete